jgi:hypothetical protein
MVLIFCFCSGWFFLKDALLKPWLIKLMPNFILIQQFFTLLTKVCPPFHTLQKHVFSHTHMYVCMYVCMCVCGTCMYVFNRYYGKWWHAMNLVNAPPTSVMKIISHFILFYFILNLRERSLKVLNFKKHGLEHCYNSLRKP